MVPTICDTVHPLYSGKVGMTLTSDTHVCAGGWVGGGRRDGKVLHVAQPGKARLSGVTDALANLEKFV